MRLLVAAALSGTGMACAQPAAPAFEVASIKPDPSVLGNRSSNLGSGRLNIRNFSLKELIEGAYEVRDFSFSGPAWLDTVHFDIVAKAPAGTKDDQIMPILRALLADRFHLVAHVEKKTVAGYALVVAKGGPKLQSVADSKGSSISTGRGRMVAKIVSMAGFADMLARQLERPVQDLTALPGNFAFTLEWTPDEAAGEKAAGGTSGPTLYTALQGQLGLKLQAQKVTIDMLVVDRAERVPTEN